MEDEKKNLPMKPMGEKDLETIKHVSKRAGQLQAFAFISNIAEVQIAHILKEMHDDGNYKQLGYKTWEEFCEECELSRSQSYKLMKNLKIAGPAVLGLLYRAGFTTRTQYLMLKGAGEIEDAEFEVLSDYEIKINGKKLSVKDNSEEALELLCGLKHKCDMARRARRDIERELEETKKDLEDKKRKIEVGEERQGKLERRAKGFQAESNTAIGRMMVELIYLAASINRETVVEADIPYLLRYLEMADLECYQRIVDKLSPHLPEDKDAI